ncbi:AraC-like DNA-binding protein/quercetin dioxygenase-like cupin family protein [Paenibacillus phyllosphaerae]|uniref:AraC-like DNA-binding protein/quercetin dioxygenase-like cupin family protein n=1 Tax=Paenibacillus phyllosphaerae TaxID=274593 RepID=A0A7W5FNZ3_9BACL|nr:AraC-like DNA-binding protein/quercetin dioxygenase-like cupin family protein [Paenibacillus phyllosphaerae]
MENETIEQSITILQDAVHKPADDQLAFLVHYWGAAKRHRTNNAHLHSFFEACYVLDGSGEYIEDSHVFPLAPGTLFLSRPHVMHQIRNEQMSLIWIGFEINAFGTNPAWQDRFARLASAGPLVRHHAQDDPLVLLWLSLCGYAMQAAESERFLFDRLTHALLAMFPGTFLGNEAPSMSRKPRSGSKVIAIAEKFIQDNIGQSLQLEELAQHCYLSSRHLARLFKQELGLSFTDYVQTYRLREAERLLRYSELSVKQIADVTGFGSVHYFTRVFSEHNGTPPALYRRQAQESSQK